MIESKSDRERQILYDITYRWNIKIQASEYSQKGSRLTDIENKLVVNREEGRKGSIGVRG